MGCPDTVFFKCPNCARRQTTQIYVTGAMVTQNLSEICQCMIPQIVDKQEICTGCKMVIVFERRTAVKQVEYVVPKIKERP